MIRGLLVAALVATAGAAAMEIAPTLAGLADEEQAGGSFTADLCADRDCKLVHAQVGDHDCGEEWHFIITRVDADSAPQSIHVTWTDGDAAVGLDRVTGQTAHYRTSSYLDQDVEDATARIHEGWDGRFTLGEGPCS